MDFKKLLQDISDAETVEDIIEHLRSSSEAKHLDPESQSIAKAVHQALVERLSSVTTPDERLATARSARAAWNKAHNKISNRLHEEFLASPEFLEHVSARRGGVVPAPARTPSAGAPEEVFEIF